MRWIAITREKGEGTGADSQEGGEISSQEGPDQLVEEAVGGADLAIRLGVEHLGDRAVHSPLQRLVLP